MMQTKIADGGQESLRTNASQAVLNEKFKLLLKEGKKVEATSPSIDISQKPEYFDEGRFSKAQETCQRYYTNLTVSSSTGLLMIIQMSSILIPLLKTGKSRTVPDLLDRYVATIRYIRNCYESKFHQPDTAGWKSISLVRAMHKRVYQVMNQTESPSNQGQVWVNQYDMAITQFAFVGLFITNPAKCAAYHVTESDLRDITYFWRVLSYYFGIEERFNLFVFDEDARLQVEYMTILLDHMNQELSSSRVPIGTRMAEGILLAFEDFTTELSFNILDHWWAPVTSISGLDEPKPYSLSDLWKLVRFNLYFVVLFRIDFILRLMNRLYKWKFDRFEAAADSIKSKLRRKYSDKIYEMQ